MRTIAIVLVGGLMLGGCSNLTPAENRALGGTALGATGGAVLGAIGGNAGLGTVLGAGAGLAGGLIYNSFKNNQ